MAPSTRGLAEWVCLALVVEDAKHGWSVARLLAPEGDVGRVWSLSRPLAYRALAQLVADELVAESRTERGAGANRTILTATPAGRRTARRWLRTPVEHLRDVRTELLVKLVLSDRAGIPVGALLEAQREAFAPAFEALARRARAADADVVDRWRYASSQGVRRFIEGELRHQ